MTDSMITSCENAFSLWLITPCDTHVNPGTFISGSEVAGDTSMIVNLSLMISSTNIEIDSSKTASGKVWQYRLCSTHGGSFEIRVFAISSAAALISKHR